jgi:esterase/lipase superfamily enzyme
MPGALAVGTIHPVFVATTRAKEADGSFGRNRTLDMQYLETKVSVPPQHKRGQIKHQFGNPDPETDFVIASQDSFAGSAEFRRELKGQITAQPAQERDVILYVHGYYNSYSDGVFRAAQLKHDLDLPGTVVHFSWPSAATPLAYTYDRDSMLFSRDALEQLLNDIRASGARRIILMGHSLGTMLIMETLRQIEIKQPGWSARSLGGVILISPDIDVDLFKSQMHRFASLPKPFAIFVSQKDRALQLSARVNGSANRLGTVTDPAELADYEVTLIDVSEFSSNREVGHFTVGTSPALIAILNRSTELDSAFQRDRAGRTGLLQGTVITVQNATQLILSPGLVVQN